MNNIYLYLSSRIAGNSLSAVDLAKNNPTESNFSFATKLLAIKMKITAMKIQKNNGDSFFINKKKVNIKCYFKGWKQLKKPINIKMNIIIMIALAIKLKKCLKKLKC
ncbi:hypothetical protein KZA80_09965 [Proteus terrae]|uniref:hypothetical protein n=1 Tax=Proteus terrae TaxID=1574161 RepID=UPI0021B2DFA3|nr:hypothetical protein [Proteus terrae]UXA36196.1 hypothetical protein KZA80_09965 [Proteus terrae]